MNLHSVAPQLDSIFAVRRKTSPLPTQQKRNRLLALLRSSLSASLSIVVPALGLMAAAMPAANAQYGVYTNPIDGMDPNYPSLENPFLTGQTLANGLAGSGLLRGSGLTASSADNRFSASGWTVGPLDTANNDYYEWTVTPSSGYALDLSNLAFVRQLIASSPTATLSLRSSLDAFGADVATTSIATSAAGVSTVLALTPAFQNLQVGTTYRLYGSDFAATSATFSINDFSFNGLVSIRWTGLADSNLSSAGNYVNNFTPGLGNGIQFEGSANPVVNVGAATTIAGIRFASGATPFTLSGSTITLGSAGGIANYSTNVQTINTNLVLTNPQVTNVNTLNGDITLGGVISSTGSITLNKIGPGTLIIGGSNTHTGVTNLNAGITKIVTSANPATPFGTSSVNLAVGATLDTNGVTNMTLPSATNGLKGTITNSAVGTTTTLTNAFTNYSPLTISGSGNITFGQTFTNNNNPGNTITKNGSGTLTFLGSSNNGGLALIVNEGVVALGKTSTNGRAVNGPVVVNGGIVRLSGSSGDQIFNDASATVTLVGGALDVLVGETLTGTLQIGNGTANGSVTGAAVLSNQSTVSAQSGTVTGNLGGPAGLTKTTSGLVTMSGNNSYIGTTTVSGGTLRASSNNALGFGGTTGVGVTSAGTNVAGGTLDIAGQSSVQESITLNGTGFDGNGALINSSTTPSVIGGGVATLTLLTGGANYNAGNPVPTVTITGGGGSGALATVTRGVSANTWSFTTNGATYSTAPNVAITGGNGSGATAVVNLDVNGAFTGITITNPGTGFTSNPLLTFSGGSLTAGSTPTATVNTNPFQISGITLTNSGTTLFTSPPTVTISAGAAGTATATANLPTMTLASTSSIGGIGDITINSAISESAAGSGLTKVGSNTVTLTAANTYTGPTTVNAGTLKLTTTTTNNVPTTSQIVLGGGTLDVTAVSGAGGFALANNQILSGAGTVSGSLTAGASNEIRPGGTGVAGTLNFGALALNGTSMTFDLGTSSDLINLGGNALTGSGTNLFTLNNLSGFGAGTYTLIDYGTSGIGLSNFALSSPTLAGFNVELADIGGAIVLNVSAIPEPSTLVLGGLALLGFAGMNLRRRRKVS